nr:hypothetical protein [Tanacetum cinerariifolium]
MSPENKAHYESEKEAIHLILTGIGDEIYSTIDACKTAQEIWEAIEWLQQGFYKMMNEMIRNNLTVATMQVNVQFLQQLQPEWSRIARNANPLALVTTAQSNQDPYYQTPKSHKPYAPTSKASIPARSHATTRNKGKEIAKPITPPSESASKEDNDPEQAQRDKDMQKKLALIAKYFKKIYKPTNNNLSTSSNSRNKMMDTTQRYMNDNQSTQSGNQRTMTIVRARENVGSLVVKQIGIQCFNCKKFGHFAKECRKQKRVKDSAYHKEKMLLCKQAEQGVPLQAEQSDWLADTNEEIDEQELEAHYSYMSKIQENDQNAVECDDERVALANLIANLKLDTEFKKCKACYDRSVEYDKLKRKLNKTLGLLAQKDIDIKEGLKLKAYEISVVKEKHDEGVKQSLLTKSHYEGLVQEKIKVITDLKQKEDRDIDKIISMEKQLKFVNEIVYKRNQTIQTIHMLAPKCPIFNGRPTFANLMYLKKAQSEKPCLYEIPNDQSDPTNRLVPDKKETLTLAEESQSKLNKDFVRPYDYTKLNSFYEIFKPASQENHEQLAHANEVRKKI